MIKCNNCGEYIEEEEIEFDGEKEYCPKCKQSGYLMDMPYTLHTDNVLDIPVSSADLQHALDFLLDIAEEYYPKYHSSEDIAIINDFYKKHLG